MDYWFKITAAGYLCELSVRLIDGRGSPTKSDVRLVVALFVTWKLETIAQEMLRNLFFVNQLINSY